MNHPISIVLLCLLSALSLVVAYVPQARYLPGCVVMGTKFYCFGGVINGLVQSSQAVNLNDHFFLDLHAPDFKASTAEVLWQIAPNPGNFVLQPNSDFAITPISADSYIMASGVGPNAPATALTNFAIVYNTTTSQWTTVQADSMPQTAGSTFVWDGKNTAYLYGGRLKSNMNLPYTPGFNTLNFFSNARFAGALGAAIPPLDLLTSENGAAFSPTDNKIYYVGGINTDNTRGNTTAGYAFIYRNPGSIVTYDTVQQNWSTLSTTGGTDGIPPVRHRQSLTYLPATNQMLMYGGNLNAVGSTGTSSKSDFCWIYDIASVKWISQCNARVNQGGAGPRYGHSAALYQKRYLLIAFGANLQDVQMSDIKILDTTAWNWVDTFPSAGSGSNSTSGSGNSTSGNGNGPDSDSQTNLSGGAIGGIAVGAVAVIGLGAFALFCFLRKRRNKETEQEDEDDEDKDMYHPMFNHADPRHSTPSPIYDHQNHHDMSMPDTHSISSGSATQKPDAQPIRLEAVKPFSHDS